MTKKHFTKLALLSLAITQVATAYAKNPDQPSNKDTPETTPSFLARFMQDDNPLRIDFNMGDHPAYAQVYGVIDIALSSINHSLPRNYTLSNNFYPYAGAKVTSRVTSRTNWVNGGLQDSRLGLRGEVAQLKWRDNDFKFVYQFEAGFNPLTMKLHDAAQTLADNSGTRANSSVNGDSSMNGELFTRQAWIGLDGNTLGRVSYGTQYNPFFEITATYDPNNKTDTFSPFGESGAVGGGGGISENARLKNSIKYDNTYATNGRGKLNYAGMYQFGNAAGSAHGSGFTAQLGYEEALFGVQLAYNKFTDTVKAVTAPAGNPLANDTIAATLYNTEAALLTLKWTPSQDLRISGGWEWFQLKPSSDKSIDYHNLWGQTVFNGVATSALKPGEKQDNHVTFIGASFDFSQRLPTLAGLSTSIGFYQTQFDAIDGPTISTSSEGKIDTWTSIIDYKFNKRFDGYMAYTTNHFSGDKYPRAQNYHEVSNIGAGLRLRF
ncbi:Outer membrane protein (porin) [Methylophilus rhizosphaerae]|uniref:Outer membrane protein (Porin) n=1 Tax=Methylophilus rhizosphaerae TaxID=492660 RepID=A0A1G9CTR4_9PROT|nr:porin [Methylophilus rhizosphaerae]SDK54835.1 Outer membrane protein (porin) [Methylophilus rhizosphaerae]